MTNYQARPSKDKAKIAEMAPRIAKLQVQILPRSPICGEQKQPTKKDKQYGKNIV